MYLIFLLCIPAADVEQQIKDEKERHKELDGEIRSSEKKVKEKHKGMGGVNNSSQNSSQTVKNNRKLENQLQMVRHIILVH